MRIILIFLISFTLSAAETFVPQSFSMSVTQVFKSELTGKEKRQKATLDYAYPKLFKFDYSDQHKKVLVSNGNESFRYTAPFIDGEKGQCVVTKGQALPLAKFFDTVTPGLVSNKDYDVIKSDDGAAIVLKTGIKEELELTRIDLLFKPKSSLTFIELAKITLTSLDGKSTELLIEKNEAKTFSKGYFEFVTPPNTIVTRR